LEILEIILSLCSYAFFKNGTEKQILSKNSNDNGIEKQRPKSKTFPKPSGYAWGTYPSVPYQLHPIIMLHSHAMLAQCYFCSDFHGFNALHV